MCSGYKAHSNASWNIFSGQNDYLIALIKNDSKKERSLKLLYLLFLWRSNSVHIHRRTSWQFTASQFYFEKICLCNENYSTTGTE
jgi:hypothetical protein